MSNRGKEKKEKSVMGTILWWLIFLLALGVFAFSVYKLVPLILEYREGTVEYDDLKQFAAVDTYEDVPVEAQEGVEEATDEEAEPEKQPGPQIDFEALKAVNEDVVGWIYVEALEDINYPIVQGKDNDYYLHRTVKRTYNFAGSIFLEAQNKPDFSDPHTLIFGHNMDNGSMFAQLKKFRQAEVYDKSRYFWICTPTRNYKYEIFSAHEVASAGEAYTLFSSPSKEVAEYAEKMKSQSEIKTPDIEFSKGSKIVTLSTCTNTNPNRFIIQGVRVY